VIEIWDWGFCAKSAISIANPQSQSPIRNLNRQSAISIANPQSQSPIRNQQIRIRQSAINKSAFANPQSAID
jgi:hypothetical protein